MADAVATGTRKTIFEEQLGKMGYECEFIEKPPSIFQSDCPVCLLVLRKPHQVTCCGKSFCKVCISKVRYKPCPTCKAKSFQSFPNKGLQQPLYQFKVRCCHQKEGCEWTGELGELDNHLNLDPQSDKQLEGCGYASIECRYKYARCKTKTERRNMATHLGVYSSEHLSLLANIYQAQSGLLREAKSQISSLESKVVEVHEQWLQRVQKHFPIPPVTLTMKHFEHYQESGQSWYSTPFYTDLRGYKMCLRADVHGTYLHLTLHTVKGEFDAELKWPFKQRVTIEAISYELLEEHNKKITFSDYLRRVTTSQKSAETDIRTQAIKLRKKESDDENGLFGYRRDCTHMQFKVTNVN